MKRFIYIILVLFACGTSIAWAPASAAQRSRCFPETSFCVAGPILAYWEANGGLAVFGYPISDLHTETVESWRGPVQWFERDRLEDHGAQGVLAGRLGARLLEIQGRPWETLSRDNPAAGCRFFEQTSQKLCGAFLAYWERNGGLARFGYPISRADTEQIGDWRGTVQYFERRRMEHHAENAGTPYEVLLGLLGRDLYSAESSETTCFVRPERLQATLTAYRQRLGCPTDTNVRSEVIAVQPFERGSMLWLQGSEGQPSTIYVITFDDPSYPHWYQFEDKWREGDPASGNNTPPPGLYEPIRGFGKIWREYPFVHKELGWATAPEQGDTGIVLPFYAAKMFYRVNADRIFVLYSGERSDGNAYRAEDIARS